MEQGLVVVVPAVDELLKVGRLRVDELARPEDVRHQVLVAQLGGNHHGVVASTQKNNYTGFDASYLSVDPTLLEM